MQALLWDKPKTIEKPKPKFTARPYQLEARNGIHNQLSNNTSTLAVLATGLGKTMLFSMVADDFLNYGKILVLAHREELIWQAKEKLLAVTGKEPDIEMGEYHSGSWNADIIVSTIQTQMSGMGGNGRMTKFDPKDFSLVIIDEAHHSAANSYRKVIEYYRRNHCLRILGVTATPDRADEKALGKIFQTVAFEYGILEGIQDGWLVPIEQQSVYVEGLDYSSVRTTAGDLNGGDLAKVLEFEEALHGIASPTIDIVKDKKTLVFAASVPQAERLTEIFNRHKSGCAAFVYAQTPKEERRQLFKGFARKDYQFLVNVGIATEGFDDPGIECVVMARPTKSRSLYAQMAGRGTRVLPGVIDCLETAEVRREAIARSTKPAIEIIDFVGNSGKHKLVTSADILGGCYDDDVVERAKKNAEEKSATDGKPVDVIDQLELAEKQLNQEKQRKLEEASRDKIKLRAMYSTAKVNPFNVLDISPRRELAQHKGKPISDKMLAVLEKNGIDSSGLNYTSAKQILGEIFNRWDKKLCTYKQAKTLRKYGYNPTDMSAKQAGEIITTIAKNGWKGNPEKWAS